MGLPTNPGFGRKGSTRKPTEPGTAQEVDEHTPIDKVKFNLVETRRRN
jgi:hypothetical protein